MENSKTITIFIGADKPDNWDWVKDTTGLTAQAKRNQYKNSSLARKVWSKRPVKILTVNCLDTEHKTS